MTEERAYRYAGFWARVGASIIDSICIGVVTAPLLYVAYGASYFEVDSPIVGGPVDFLISWVLPAVGVILFWIYCQATPGKMVFSMKIVDAKTGGPMTKGQSILRYFGYFVSTAPLCLGLMWVGIDPRKQGWHDKIAGTLVVHD